VADRLSTALARAHEALAHFAPELVCKGIWGSPAGKTHLAQRIVAEIPEHRVYVEPFAGGAQVLFTKEPSEVEVVSDLDPEIAFAFRFAKGITPEQIQRLRAKKWVGDKAHFRKLYEADVPGDDLERFYRFAYLIRFSFNKLRRGTMPDKNVGVEARFVDKLERLAPRLKAVRVRNADYEKVIEEYDGPDTFFFLDPPYAGHDADCRVGAGHKDWDEERFGQVLRKIRGKFLCTYGLRGDAELFKGFHTRRWRHTSGVGTSQGQGLRPGTTLVATNYDPDKARRFQVAVSKTIWGSPAGKKKLAARLVALLPAHKTYVEPFAGSAAVLFAKDPAETEVINDADLDIARAFRTIKRLTRGQIERLGKMPWTGDEATFKGLIDATPRDDVAWLHRFLYLTHFSYGKMRGKSFSPSTQGIEAKTAARIEAFAPRLKNVRIYGGDYGKVVAKYDSPNTVFFFDPPYPGYNVDVGESDFDEDRFFGVLKSLKGKFLLTYGVRGKLPGLLKDAGFAIKRIRTPRSIGSMRGVGGPSVLTQLVVANYDLVEKTEDGVEPLLEDWHGQLELGDAARPEAEVEKAQAFGTFGGSHHYAKRLLPRIPEHTTYVEPFAGAAALLYAKEPSAREVVADNDADVVFLHRAVKAMTPERVAELARRFEWKCTEESFAKARDMEPKDDVERFYKLVFVRTHARDCRPDGTHPARNHLGSTTNPEKYLRAAERLRDVSILQQDYKKTVAQLDGPDTFFFLDPPYPGEWFDKDAVIDLDEFVGVLKGIKGRFIAVLNDSPENVAAFKSAGHVFRLKVHEASGTGGAKKASRLFCANYAVAKSDDVELLGDEAGADPAAFTKSIPIIKGVDPDDERFVLGVVLEPEVVDAQGDIYSAEEIRQAAHRFMDEFGGLGLMHRFRVNGQVKVLESYLAPADVEIGGVRLRKGTWLLAVRILSDELWEQVKDGALTGFSIGGSARRVSEGRTPPEGESAGRRAA
jgi:DNA adenine methylase